MPIKSYKMGPGTLTIGEVGSPVDFTAQITKCVVSWKEDAEDNVPVLSGEELEGDSNWSATLSGTVIQELSDGGIIEWTWTEKGNAHPFTFTPSTSAGKAVSGTVKVGPLDLGGDAKKRPTSDFEWACVGEPTLGDDLT